MASISSLGPKAYGYHRLPTREPSDTPGLPDSPQEMPTTVSNRILEERVREMVCKVLGLDRVELAVKSATIRPDSYCANHAASLSCPKPFNPNSSQPVNPKQGLHPSWPLLADHPEPASRNEQVDLSPWTQARLAATSSFRRPDPIKLPRSPSSRPSFSESSTLRTQRVAVPGAADATATQLESTFKSSAYETHVVQLQKRDQSDTEMTFQRKDTRIMDIDSSGTKMALADLQGIGPTTERYPVPANLPEFFLFIIAIEQHMADHLRRKILADLDVQEVSRCGHP